MISEMYVYLWWRPEPLHLLHARFAFVRTKCTAAAGWPLLLVIGSELNRSRFCFIDCSWQNHHVLYFYYLLAKLLLGTDEGNLELE